MGLLDPAAPSGPVPVAGEFWRHPDYAGVWRVTKSHPVAVSLSHTETGQVRRVERGAWAGSGWERVSD